MANTGIGTTDQPGGQPVAVNPCSDGLDYQVVKLDVGGDGTAQLADAGHPLPVSLPASQVTTLTPPAAITNYAAESGGHLAAIDTNAGTTADAAVTTDVSGTLSAKLRGLVKLVASVISGGLVQTRALTSSDQVTVANASLAVTGPLTDAQLRAAAVPVSAASLPLPSGAATSTKQSDGTQKTQVVDGSGNVIGSTSNALDINIKSGNPTSITVSGSVTANAGTNLNTSALATEATLDARTGSLTETAPATDTASSGINGRLQRIAQRLTSLIALLPSALTGSGNLKVSLQESNASQAVTGTFWQATQPISGTVTANIGTSGSLALDATLTGGTQKAIARGGAKGATTAADLTSTAEGTDHQALDVQIMHGGTAKDPTQIRALTAADVVALGAGTAEIGNVKNSGAFAVQATLAAETTKVIGTVNIAASQTVGLAAGTNIIGFTTPTPVATGGNSLSSLLVNAVTAKTLVKSNAGNLYGIHLYNPNTSAVFVQMFKASSTGAVTLGTTTPDFVWVIPPASVLDKDMTIPVAFTTGLVYAVTTTATGSTAPSSGVTGTIFYL